MAIAGKIALLATLRAVYGEPYFAGGTATPAAISFRLRASPSASILHLPSCARSAAARSSVAVASVAGGNPSFGGAGKRSGAEAEDAVADATDPGRGGAGKGSGAQAEDAITDAAEPGRVYFVLGADEALRAARIVAFFLFIQKAFFLREKKVSDITRKCLLMVLIGLSVWAGFMATKGANWAVVLAGTTDKADKIYKIVTIITAVFK